MSDENDIDDYLSDKFLTASGSSSSTIVRKTYSEIRKDAEKQSRIKNDQNKKKSRRQLELDAREEGLSQSLFSREQDSGNKALSIMMKMGFKPGQALGKPDDDPPKDREPDIGDPVLVPKSQHRAEPLPLNEWEGRKGIGSGTKRKRSPSSIGRVAKMTKMANDASHSDFRDRSRQAYDERRSEGRLGPAQRTCVSLDEKAGKSFNILWLNLLNQGSFPPGLLDALSRHTGSIPAANESIETRLRNQMRADALQPISDSSDAPAADSEDYSDILDEAAQFLSLQARDRLELVLSYLRDRYSYCFWCGTQYGDADEMVNQCPGKSEDDHD